MKHYLIPATLVLLFCFPVKKGQAQVPKIEPSVDAKMLGGSSVAAGLSGISSPNLFNGSMNITVPIYNFSSGKGSYGVSVSYNTQGVKVDEFATRVGLHWNLNCGGSIVRIVRDLPDEYYQNTDSLLPALSLHQNQNNDSTVYVPNKEMHIYGKLTAYGESAAKLSGSNAYVDNSCDEFIVSIDGSSFKFYIGKNLKVFTTSPGNFKIRLLADSTAITNVSQLITTNQQNDFITSHLNFLIEDPQGNQYYFKAAQQGDFEGSKQFWDWAYLLNPDALPQGSSPFETGMSYPISWSLQKVIFANGQEITYHYASSYEKNDNVSAPSYRSYYVWENVEEEEAGLAPFFMGVGNTDALSENPIKSIHYPNNVQVNFDYDSLKWNNKGDFFIKDISISSGSNCKKFLFFQDQDNTNKRYFLDSIKQSGCDQTTIEPYFSFNYNPIASIHLNSQGPPPVYDTSYYKLPKRLNSGQDLYGYFNGDPIGIAGDYLNDESQSPGDSITIPKHHPDLSGNNNYGGDRSYAPQYAQAGLITTVENAYGGVTHLYYGGNVIDAIPLANSIPTDNNFIGADQPDGVRVDSVINTDPYKPGSRTVTTFTYSGGQIFMPGGYFQYPVYFDTSTDSQWSMAVYQSFFLTPHQLVQNSNHGYSTVAESTLNDQDQLISKTEYTFTNMEDATSGGQPRYYKVSGSKDYFEYPYTDKQYLKDWAIGLPLSVTSYDQNGRIIKKTTNYYDFSKPVDLSAASIISNDNTIKVNSGAGGGTYEGYDIELPLTVLSLDDYFSNKKTFTDPYYPFKGLAPLTSTVTQKYVSDTRYVTDTVWYQYDDHNNLVSTITQDSKGQKTATDLIYNYTVDGPSLSTNHPGTALYNMTDSGLEEVVATERWKLDPTVVLGQSLLSAFITKYQYQNGKLWTEGLLNTDIGNPVPFTQYAGSPVNGIYVNRYNRILSAYNTTGVVTDFIRTSDVDLFDVKGNPNETRLLDQNQYKAMIWDTASGQKLAEATNCRYSDMAYTSFETVAPEEGNFTWSPLTATPASNAVTGDHVGSLWTQVLPGTAISISGTQTLSSKPYTLSFWSYGAVPAVSVGSQAITVSAANLVYTKGSWHNYQVTFTPSTPGTLKITGTAALSEIDEIRLYPAGAQMDSWTYTPLFGKSSYTDPSGRVTYYQYDKMGRQDRTLDQDGNILSQTDYHIAQ